MNSRLHKNILKLAAEICEMHSDIASNWSGSRAILDSLTAGEKNEIMWQYEKFNSNGEDFEAGYFPEDGMVISMAVAVWIRKMIETISFDE